MSLLGCRLSPKKRAIRCIALLFFPPFALPPSPPQKKRKRVHASIPDAPSQTVNNRLLTKAPRPDGNKSPKRLGARAESRRLGAIGEPGAIGDLGSPRRQSAPAPTRARRKPIGARKIPAAIGRRRNDLSPGKGKLVAESPDLFDFNALGGILKDGEKI